MLDFTEVDMSELLHDIIRFFDLIASFVTSCNQGSILLLLFSYQITATSKQKKKERYERGKGKIKQKTRKVYKRSNYSLVSSSKGGVSKSIKRRVFFGSNPYKS